MFAVGFKDELNRFREILARLCQRFPLSVGTRQLRDIADVPAFFGRLGKTLVEPRLRVEFNVIKPSLTVGLPTRSRRAQFGQGCPRSNLRELPPATI